jgi:pentatricopeptide repeat protein
MSLLRALDGTTCSVKAGVNTTVSRPLLSFLYPGPLPFSVAKNTRRSFSQSPMSRPPRVAQQPPDAMDAFFIQALARAGSCQEHQRQISTLRDIVPAANRHHRTRRKSTMHGGRKQFHESTKARGPFTTKVKQFAESELRALVDYYGIDVDGPAPEETGFDDIGLFQWNVGDDHQPWPLKETAHGNYIEELEKLLEDEESPHDAIFDCYQRLPAPSAAYLKIDTIRKLLHHLSIVERPTPIAMQRFLSILDDMKDAHIHIIRSEWTTAIHFAGRCLGPVSTESLQSALQIWRDMEKRAGVRGGTVTLNVLFNVAVKAGRYSLAEVFLKELQQRNLKLHRHFRISILYYYGVMQNGNAVRRTYQALVSAGDVVDTVVMNAVISALFRAGEPSAAEQVFERMKRLHGTKTSKRKPNPRNWRENREMGLSFTYEGRKLAHVGDAAQQKELQDSAPIAPDSRTYGLVIRHYATHAGNIDRVQELLTEMKHKGIPLDGTISIVILRGFASFGGVRYSSWTSDKLEKVWRLYLQAIREGTQQRTWVSPMAVLVALKAFRKCAGEERTLRAWDEVRGVWEPSVKEREEVLKELRRLVPSAGSGFFGGNV